MDGLTRSGDVMRNSNTQKINLLFFIDFRSTTTGRLYGSLDRHRVWGYVRTFLYPHPHHHRRRQGHPSMQNLLQLPVSDDDALPVIPLSIHLGQEGRTDDATAAVVEHN